MLIFKSINKLVKYVNFKESVGFVPTMGALHAGHIPLIKKSKVNCKKTLVSIFINPSQFNDKKDFNKYPRNLKKDISTLKKLKINYLFLPNNQEIYKKGIKKKLMISKNDRILCAKHRKGHFEGVLAVVNRFMDNIHSKYLFLGEKDFQQLYLIKKYIPEKYNAKIISCKTIRDFDKFAFSSRNKLLSKNELIQAGKISKEIFLFKKKLYKSKEIKKIINKKKRELINLFNIKFDYFELRNKFNLKISNKAKYSKLFIAYYINKVRLIDNF